MPNFRRRQFYFTLAYFIPVLILIIVSTFLVLRMHREAFDNIRTSLAEQSFDSRALQYFDEVDGTISNEDWDNLSAKEIDEKLLAADLVPIGDPEDPFYNLSGIEIDLLSDERYDELYFEYEDQLFNEDVLAIDFTDDESLAFQYITISEYEAITSELYESTYRTIITTSLFLSILFALVAYRLSVLVMRPLIQAYEEQKKFISDASHELRTPVAILQSEVDLVKKIGTLSEERKELFIKNISQSTTQMKHVIDQLLTLSRLGRESIVLHKETINCTDLVDDISHHFDSSIKNKGIVFRSNVDKNLSLYSDYRYVLQTLTIIVDNAIKHNQATDGIIDINISNHKSKICIEVINTGNPIPQDQLANIFKRFTRVSESRTDEGLGLGLAIAQEIMQNLDGSISLKNTSDGKIMTTLLFPKK